MNSRELTCHKIHHNEIAAVRFEKWLLYKCSVNTRRLVPHPEPSGKCKLKQSVSPQTQCLSSRNRKANAGEEEGAKEALYPVGGNVN
jgi:hypothetical protein